MDYAHTITDKELRGLERRITEEFSSAAEEVKKKIAAHLQTFADKDADKLKQVAAGEISPAEYVQWRTVQITTGRRWQRLADTLIQDMQAANARAQEMTRQLTFDVYALNHNYGTYEVETGSLIDTAYSLYDKSTVERLFIANPDLLPPPGAKLSKKIREKKAILWNKQQLQSVMTQSLLQGESIPRITQRIDTLNEKTAEQAAQRFTTINRNAAIRNARTMTTGAENAGRVDSYKRAEAMGIEMQQQWVATLDGRTRHEHRQLDGVRVAVGKPFNVNGRTIRFPGDPTAAPEMVYNCRCTLIGVVKGTNVEAGALLRSSRLKDITYEEWKNGKQVNR